MNFIVSWPEHMTSFSSWNDAEMTTCQALRSYMFFPAFNSTIAMRSACLNLLACSYAGEKWQAFREEPSQSQAWINLLPGDWLAIWEMQKWWLSVSHWRGEVSSFVAYASWYVLKSLLWFVCFAAVIDSNPFPEITFKFDPTSHSYYAI